MSFSPTEEQILRDLIKVNSELENLAGSEPEIMESLGSSLVPLDQLPPTSVVNEPDLIHIKQGEIDHSMTVKQFTDTFKSLFLRAAENLADLSDKAISRFNLGVYSKQEVDATTATFAKKDGTNASGKWPIAIGGKADTSGRADSALRADTSGRADSAANADNAARANNAGRADTSGRADSAAIADNAARANNAGRADTSGRADSAAIADRANTAAKADNATNADRANTAAKADNLVGLGYTGEVWRNVAFARQSGVVYKNLTGKPISLAAGGNYAGPSPRITAYCDGALVSDFSWQYNGAGALAGAFIPVIPPNSQYALYFDSCTIRFWAELY